MNEFLIKLIGIVMLVSTPMENAPNGKHVVIPAWTAPNGGHVSGEHIPPHVPYIAFTKDTCARDVAEACFDASDWGTPIDFPFQGAQWAYLTLDGLALTFATAKETPLQIDSSYALVPHMSNYCPQFQLDDAFRDDRTNHPLKAATFDIDRGILSARGDILKDEPAESWWRLETDRELVIIAKPFNGDRERTLILQPGTKIRIGNQVKEHLLGLATGPTDVHKHFLVFQAMNKGLAPSTCVAQPGPHRAIPGRDPLVRTATIPDCGRVSPHPTNERRFS
jgi:hypothetical protein